MKCEICHLHDATHAILRKVDGVRRELYVCDACARVSASDAAPAKDVGDAMRSTLEDMIVSIGLPVPANLARKVEDATCPVCGMSRAELRAKRRFGCPKCFDVFDADVRTILSNRVAVTSRGRFAPGRALDEREITRLKEALAKAVLEDRFEDAKKLSAQLHALLGDKEGAEE